MKDISNIIGCFCLCFAVLWLCTHMTVAQPSGVRGKRNMSCQHSCQTCLLARPINRVGLRAPRGAPDWLMSHVQIARGANRATGLFCVPTKAPRCLHPGLFVLANNLMQRSHERRFKLWASKGSLPLTLPGRQANPDLAAFSLAPATVVRRISFHKNAASCGIDALTPRWTWTTFASETCAHAILRHVGNADWQ